MLVSWDEFIKTNDPKDETDAGMLMLWRRLPENAEEAIVVTDAGITYVASVSHEA